MESFDILVIILSVALLISTIVWIIAGIMAIKLLKKARKVSNVAKSAADNIEQFSSTLVGVGNLAIVGNIAKVVSTAIKGRKK